MKNILEEKKELEEKIGFEELNAEKYNSNFLIYLITILSTFPLDLNIKNILISFILLKSYYDYKKYKYHIGLKELYEKQLNELKNNCQHEYWYDCGYYYFSKNLKEMSTVDRLIADFRTCKCLVCDEEIEMFKTSNPNWDFTYDNQEIDIRQKKKIKKFN